MRKNMKISPVMQQITGNHENVEVEGSTIRECMENLIIKYPDLHEWFDENRPIAWVVLNQELVRIPDLDKQLSEADELSVTLVIGGG